MTTPAAARHYLARHEHEVENKKWAVYNPKDLPLSDLPIIYGFNNGGSRNWLNAQLISEDGMGLGGHICSAEGYMESDLGILEGTAPDRHESFQKYYPDGYRMCFVKSNDIADHKGLQLAFEKGKALQKEKDNDDT